MRIATLSLFLGPNVTFSLPSRAPNNHSCNVLSYIPPKRCNSSLSPRTPRQKLQCFRINQTINVAIRPPVHKKSSYLSIAALIIHKLYSAIICRNLHEASASLNIIHIGGFCILPMKDFAQATHVAVCDTRKSLLDVSSAFFYCRICNLRRISHSKPQCICRFWRYFSIYS